MSKRRVIKPRFWVFMMATLVLVFACVYVSQGQLLARQAMRIEDLELARKTQMNTNELLNRKIAFSKTDEYVERVAHEQLGLLKKNEIRFVPSGQADGS